MRRSCLFGCFSVPVLGVALLLILGLYVYRAVTDGPMFDGAAFSISGREIPISQAAADRLDAKLADFAAGLAAGQPQVLELTEEEINSKLATELQRLKAEDPNLPIEWAFLELQDGEATAYARVKALGMAGTVSAPVEVGVVDRRPQVEIGAVRVGNLPPVPGLSDAASSALEEAGVGETLQNELPAVVDEVRIEEGKVTTVVSP